MILGIFDLLICPAQGFAERKILLLCDVIAACKKIHNDEIRKERLAALKTRVKDTHGSNAQSIR
jgi:hypothetical protein